MLRGAGEQRPDLDQLGFEFSPLGRLMTAQGSVDAPRGVESRQAERGRPMSRIGRLRWW